MVNSKSSSTRNLVLLVLFFEAQHYWSELFIVPPEFRLHPPSIHHPPVSKPRRRRRMLWSATEILRPRPRPATGVVLDRDGSQDQNSPSIFGITMYHIYIYSYIIHLLPNDSHHLPCSRHFRKPFPHDKTPSLAKKAEVQSPPRAQSPPRRPAFDPQISMVTWHWDSGRDTLCTYNQH